MIKMRDLLKQIKESTSKFKIKQDDERIIISLQNIGEVILAETTPEYEFLEDIGEDALNDMELEPDDFIGKIEHLEVNDEFKGKGYGKVLMDEAIKYAKTNQMFPLYLNASPMGSSGLDSTNLEGFYEKFGFETFLNQGHNKLMILRK